MICDNCMHFKNEESSVCRCTEGKIIGVMYIGLFNDCVYWNENTKIRCKAKCTIRDEFKLYVCESHCQYKKKIKKKEVVSRCE